MEVIHRIQFERTHIKEIKLRGWMEGYSLGERYALYCWHWQQ